MLGTMLYCLGSDLIFKPAFRSFKEPNVGIPLADFSCCHVISVCNTF